MRCPPHSVTHHSPCLSIWNDVHYPPIIKHVTYLLNKMGELLSNMTGCSCACVFVYGVFLCVHVLSPLWLIRQSHLSSWFFLHYHCRRLSVSPCSLVCFFFHMSGSQQGGYILISKYQYTENMAPQKSGGWNSYKKMVQVYNKNF